MLTLPSSHRAVLTNDCSLPAVRRLELNRRVLNAKTLCEHLRKRSHLCRILRCVCCANVRAQRGIARADAPQVQIMHLLYPCHLRHRLRHITDVHSFGRPLKQDVQRRTQHTPRPRENDDADERADERVNDVPARQQHHDPADDDTDRRERVAEHVQECARRSS